LAKDFKPQFNNEEAFNRRLREAINSTLEPIELESRRTRIMGQIRQEQLSRVVPLKPRPTGFRLSPYRVGGFATLLLAIGLVFFILLSNESRTFSITVADGVVQKLPTAGLASSNESRGAGAPNAVLPNTTAAATTLAAAAVRQSTAAATTAAAGVAPQPTFAPNFFTAGELWLQYPASQHITVDNQLALDYLRKLTTALSENDKLRSGLKEPIGFKQYRVLHVSGTSVDSVAQYYRDVATQRNLKLEAIPASDAGNIAWQWLYLNGTDARYGVLLVEFKGTTPNPFGNGNINRGDILIVIAT